MCGILFVKSRKGSDVSKPLLKRFGVQKGRGQEGFGFMSVNRDGHVSDVFRAEELKDTINAVRECEDGAILFHHRFPTSTPNYAGATHPIAVKDARFEYDYYVIHNGVIQNDDALFEIFKKEGHVFTTEIEEVMMHRFVNSDEKYTFEKKTKFNDSEVFAIDLARVLEGQQQYLRSSGSIAFIAIQATKDGVVKSVLWGHNNGNPLVIEDDNTLLALKSLGHGKAVPVDVLFTMDWDTGVVTERKLDIGFFHGRVQSSMGFHSHGGPRDDDGQDPYWDGARANGSRVRTLSVKDQKNDEIDTALTKFLPAGKPSKLPAGYEEDDVVYEHPLSPDMQQMVDDISRRLGDDDEWEPAYSSEELKKVVAERASDGEYAAEIQQLNDDLQEVLLKEEGAILEVEAAQDLLKSAARRNILAEIEDAQSLLDAARWQLKEIRKVRQGTEAELSAFLGE